jgi:2-C-methyl-D-erythritol 2,4-cyclodiphosphate synthase/2-C-methyl-D-erythritol 4-phosphate cytidylyltransferase
MGTDKTKQLIDIFGKTVLERTVSAFDKSELIDEIIVVYKDGEEREVQDALRSISDFTSIKLVKGGSCRAESAKNGFSVVNRESDFVAIHDAARCLITPEMINKVVKKAYETNAATAACAVHDTVKMVDENAKIVDTIPRSCVYMAQTPQVFARHLYESALDNCDDMSLITDDNMLVEKLGIDIHVVDLGSTNIKITKREDLSLAENILSERGEGIVSSFRIGHGYDVHKLAEGRKLIIGGVEIPYERGLLGHSDADVLLHAVMDSLLGAAALGDIGRHFPDSSPEYKGISSMHLLTRVVELIRENGFEVVNVDATLVMQKPKIAPYVPKMVSNIAFALGITENSVNVKATTEEHLGFTGREEGASAHCVAMLAKK